MSTLVHINGPTAAGKSSIAERLVDERPLTLCLDIDVLRVRLGRWAENPESKRIARDLGFAVARRHLETGHDVLLPQLTVRDDVLQDLERLATDAGAAFVEVILVADPGELVARAQLGRLSPGKQHPRDLFTLEELGEQTLYALDALARIAAARTDARVVDVSGMSLDQASAAVQAVLG